MLADKPGDVVPVAAWMAMPVLAVTGVLVSTPRAMTTWCWWYP